MNAMLEKTDVVQRVLLKNVSWETYVRLCDEIGERHIRFTYDDGDLEIMTLSFDHESAARWIGVLIRELAHELGLRCKSGGMTTMRASSKTKAAEADETFWIKNQPAMRGKKEWTPAAPPPDIAVEVDISRSSLDRFAIYAKLGVPEIWRFDGEKLEFFVLRAGKYRTASKSRSFPELPLVEFVRFVEVVDVDDESSLRDEFNDWLKENL